MIYTTPLHQYPTTVSLTAQRRLALYELCSEHNILILEDDYDHEFHYTSQPIAPLAANDPAQIVLYISTFSKVLFPSARVGFMAVPEKIAEQVALLKRITSRQNEQIMQDAIARWMASGDFERHLRKMRRIYDDRRMQMINDLEKIKKDFPLIEWKAPNGGMALWLNLNRDSKQISDLAAKHFILVNPEVSYQVRPAQGTHLRLGFSGQTTAENRAGLLALFGLITPKKI